MTENQQVACNFQGHFAKCVRKMWKKLFDENLPGTKIVFFV